MVLVLLLTFEFAMKEPPPPSASLTWTLFWLLMFAVVGYSLECRKLWKKIEGFIFQELRTLLWLLLLQRRVVGRRKAEFKEMMKIYM